MAKLSARVNAAVRQDLCILAQTFCLAKLVATTPKAAGQSAGLPGSHSHLEEGIGILIALSTTIQLQTFSRLLTGATVSSSSQLLACLAVGSEGMVVIPAAQQRARMQLQKRLAIHHLMMNWAMILVLALAATLRVSVTYGRCLHKHVTADCQRRPVQWTREWLCTSIATHASQKLLLSRILQICR